MFEIRIQKEIFDAFPGFKRGLVIARDLRNQGPSEELNQLLQDTIVKRFEAPINLETDERILSWLEAHRGFGSNPNKFPPAHVALLKRIQKKKTALPLINKVVAIMNLASIEAVMPVGGDDLSAAGSILELKYAQGDEKFVPLGEPDTVEQALPGEIIYYAPDTGRIMCRRWNWRNGHMTRIGETTSALVMNIDGLGVGVEERTLLTRDRVAHLLQQFCGASVTTALLSGQTPLYQLT